MPIYEYQCDECHHNFEALVRTGVTPNCPACQGMTLRKQHSAFAVGRGGSANSLPAPVTACGTCGDPRGAGACSMN